MTKPIKAVIPLKKINIVEDSRWKPWSTDGKAMQYAEQSADQEMSTLDCGSLGDLVFPIFNSGSRRRYLTDAEEDALCENWKDAPELEDLYLLIERVTRDAWYFAYTPSDSDIEYAIDQAKSIAAENAHMFTDHIVESTFDMLGIDGEVLARSILNDYVFYQRKPGWYDRYLILDLGRSPEIRRLVDKPIEDIPMKSVLAWRPSDALQAGLRPGLEDFLLGLGHEFVNVFFRQLEAVMDSVDPGNVVDFNKQWRHTLLFSPKEVKEVRKSIEKYLSKLPPEETEDNG